MAEVLRIGFFLEDIAHERILRRVVERCAASVGIDEQRLTADIRNATHGSPAVLSEFRRYLRRFSTDAESPFDVLIVAIDGNCSGYTTKKREILELAERSSYPGIVVVGVPDPHIEKWYMADGQACRHAIAAPVLPNMPGYKCERQRYKRVLLDYIKSTGVVPLLGGAEYGPQIADAIDLQHAKQNDPSLGHFVTDLREAFVRILGHAE